MSELGSSTLADAQLWWFLPPIAIVLGAASVILVRRMLRTRVAGTTAQAVAGETHEATVEASAASKEPTPKPSDPVEQIMVAPQIQSGEHSAPEPGQQVPVTDPFRITPATEQDLAEDEKSKSISQHPLDTSTHPHIDDTSTPVTHAAQQEAHDAGHRKDDSGFQEDATKGTADTLEVPAKKPEADSTESRDLCKLQTPSEEPDVPPNQAEPAKEAEDDTTKVRDPGKRHAQRVIGERPVPSAPTEEKTTVSSVKRLRHPKLICWKRGQRWHVGIQTEGVAMATQAGTPLERLDADRLTMRAPNGKVEVTTDDGRTVEFELGPAGDNLLLFKLTKDDDEAFYVRWPSTGMFLTVVPSEWTRDDESSESPPVQPETAAYPGYKVHFFFFDGRGDSRVRFRTVTGELRGRDTLRFSLLGRQLADSDPKSAPLFSKVPPQIRASVPDDWESISAVAVSKKDDPGFQADFVPRTGSDIQQIPEETIKRILASGCGQYQYALIGKDGHEIGQLDFRFVAGVNDVRVERPQPFPSAEGHPEVRVEIEHEERWEVVPDSTLIRIEHLSGKSLLLIPRDHRADCTQITLKSNHLSERLQITIQVERVWWNLGSETEPSHWKDVPVRLVLEDFRATSPKAIWIRLPKARWTNGVALTVGEPENWREFPLRVTDRVIRIPLRELGGSDVTVGSALQLRINREGSTIQGTIGTVSVPDQRRARPLHLSRSKARSLELLLRRMGSKCGDEGRRISRAALKRSRSTGLPWQMSSAYVLCAISLILETECGRRFKNSIKPIWLYKAQVTARRFPEIADELRNSE